MIGYCVIILKMNIHGYKQNLRKAREIIKREMKKGRYKNIEKIENIESGMNILRNKIKKLKEQRK